MATSITATNNAGVPVLGITVVISGSLGQQNVVQYLSPMAAQWQDSGVQITGDGVVYVPSPSPLDPTLAYQIRVKSAGITETYSNVQIVCPTTSQFSEMTSILCGLQVQLIGLNIQGIENRVFRAEDVQQINGVVMSPCILLQKDVVPERRKKLDTVRTNWAWPIVLTIQDRTPSPTNSDQVHNYWRLAIITALDRLSPLPTYPKCKVVEIEPGYIQGNTVTGPQESTQGGYDVWVSQLKLWCETDLLIGRYVQAQSVTVFSGGSGYAVGDIIQLEGGIANPFSQLQVLQVSGGSVTVASIATNGIYGTSKVPGLLATPPNPVSQASTSGSGTGATFTMTWGQ